MGVAGVLMSSCCAGGLSLGLICTTSEAEPAVVAGLELLKSVLPSNVFFSVGLTVFSHDR